MSGSKRFIQFSKAVYKNRLDLNAIISYSSAGEQRLGYETAYQSNCIHFHTNADRDEALLQLDKVFKNEFITI